MNMEKIITPFYLMKEIKMNTFIKTDIENAVILMKAAIMNALHDIDMGVEKEIVLGPNISWNLFYTCLEEADWKVEDLDQWWDPNGWEVDFWCPVISPSGKSCIIDGSLWGQNYSIRINNE